MAERAALLLLTAILALPLQAGQGKPSRAPAVVEIDAARLKGVLAKDSGNVIMLNAWASWCKPCKAEIPDLLRLRREYYAKGLRVIFISADDPDLIASAVQPTLESLGVDFITYIDRDSSDEAFINGLNAAWSGALPATFLFDRSGNQTAMFVGARTYREFERAVLPLLR